MTRATARRNANYAKALNKISLGENEVLEGRAWGGKLQPDRLFSVVRAAYARMVEPGGGLARGLGGTVVKAG